MLGLLLYWWQHYPKQKPNPNCVLAPPSERRPRDTGACLSTPRMEPYQQPGEPLNTQDGALSATWGVPLNTQDGASQHPGWCLSMPRTVPLNTQDGASASTQEGTSLDVAAEHLGEYVGSREHSLTL